MIMVQIRAGEPDRPEPHDLAGAILFFLQEPEHFKKLEWIISDIILQAKKLFFFGFAVIQILFQYTKINN